MRIVDIKKDKKINLEELGGKGKNLYLLYKAGFNIPDFFVIPLSFFQDFIKPVINKIRDIEKECIKNPNPAEISRKMKTLFDSLEFTSTQIKEIKDFLNIYNFEKIAVRSSCELEDEKGLSFAGQYDSFLNVEKSKIFEAIKKVYSSLFSERAIEYRMKNDLPIFDIKMAAIVQRMIDAEKSGVIFTQSFYEPNKITISITSGPGDRLVKGESVPEQRLFYYRDKKNFNVQGDKILTSKEIEKIVEQALKIEKFFGFPQDIEWCFKDETLYILQARPLSFIKNYLVWDNSNIIESFPGLTKPLTFSIANECYFIIYKTVCKILGASAKKIEENEDIFLNMIGYVKNRIYYNLLSWYKALALLPGFKYTKGFMEQMMGLREKKEFKEEEFRTKILSLPFLFYTFLRIFINFLLIDLKTKNFFKNFEQTISYVKRKDFSLLSPSELLDIYFYMRRRLIYKWNAPIINDFFTMIFFGLLKKFVEKRTTDKEIFAYLLSGEEKMWSLLPLIELERIVKRIREKNVKDWKKDEEIKNLIEYYMERFGYRTINELKLEEKSLKEDEEYLSFLINSLIEVPLEERMKNSKENFKKAKRKMINILRKKPFRFLFDYSVFNFLLTNARKCIRRREDMRFARTFIFGILRELFREMGRKFKILDIIENEEDVFYLHIGEIIGLFKGTLINEDLKRIIRIRKEEFEKNKKTEYFPEHFETHEIVYKNKIVSEIHKEKGILKGIPCVPGVVEGEAVIVKDPKKADFLKDKIIIAERTDPGWVHIFGIVRGIVVERGSALSHSAIIARELGVPLVIGVKNVTRLLKNGMRIRMDAFEGKIEVLS